MKIYQYHSGSLNCNITVSYLDGLLHKVEIEGFELQGNTPPSAQFIISEFAFLNSCKKYNVKYIELVRTITFEMFWERYKYKVDKSLAEKAWIGLSKEDQYKAYDFIPMYEAQLKANGNLAKKYAVRYFKHKPWIQ